MITKLINKMSKRKYHYKTYEIDDTSKYLDQTLSSPLLGEGNVSLKVVVNNKQIKNYITLPTSIHYPLKRAENEQKLPKMTTFQAELDCNNFFTLNLFAKRCLNDLVKDIIDFTGEHEHFVFHLIAKKIRSQGRRFVDQYEHFTKGVEVPSSNPIVSAIQKHCIDDDKIFIPMDIINLIEHKITDQHYQFQLFIGMKFDSREKEELVEGLLHDVLDEYSHLNAFVLQDHKHDEVVFTTNELLFQYKKQYISRSELCCVVHKELPDTVVETQIDTSDNATPMNSQPILQPTSTYALDTLPSLELLPVQCETTEDDVDMEIPNRIKNALKRVKIVNDSKSVNVIDFKVGSSLIKTTVSIPKDKNFSDIERKDKDIRVALGASSLSVDQGEVPDSVSFFIPRTNKQPIYLRTLLENDEFIKYAENHPLPFVIGVDPLNRPIYACLNKLTHLLAVGQTNSGKSVWLNQLILTLLMLRKPTEMMMYLIDPKQVEFAQFNGFPQVAKVLDNMNEANKLLENLIIEMENRYSTYLKEGKVKTLWEYNKKYPDKKVPFIVVVIDEYADLKTVNPTVADYLSRLGAKARASGIHVIVATQRPSVDVIDGTTKANLPSKISFKLDSSASYRTVFESKPPYNLTGKGHGIMSLLDQTKQYEQFQGAIISVNAQEEELVFDKIKKSFKGEKVEGIKIEKVEEKEEPIIKMKRIIAETGEVRVSELRKLMEMNINVVTELMHQLADEGWLNRPDEENRKWSLNDECEELNKLRQLYGGN